MKSVLPYRQLQGSDLTDQLKLELVIESGTAIKAAKTQAAVEAETTVNAQRDAAQAWAIDALPCIPEQKLTMSL